MSDKRGRTFWDFLSEQEPILILIGFIFLIGTIASLVEMVVK